MTTQPRWHGPLVERDGRLSPALVNYLRSLGTGTDSATETADDLETRVEALEAADVTIFGTNGVQVFETSENTFEVRGPGDTDDLMTPYYIAEGESFFVPEYKQVISGMPLELDGTLSVSGYWIEC